MSRVTYHPFWQIVKPRWVSDPTGSTDRGCVVHHLEPLLEAGDREHPLHGSGPRTITIRRPASRARSSAVTMQRRPVESRKRELRQVEHDDGEADGLHAPQLLLDLGHRGQVELSHRATCTSPLRSSVSTSRISTGVQPSASPALPRELPGENELHAGEGQLERALRDGVGQDHADEHAERRQHPDQRGRRAAARCRSRAGARRPRAPPARSRPARWPRPRAATRGRRSRAPARTGRRRRRRAGRPPCRRRSRARAGRPVEGPSRRSAPRPRPPAARRTRRPPRARRSAAAAPCRRPPPRSPAPPMSRPRRGRRCRTTAWARGGQRADHDDRRQRGAGGLALLVAEPEHEQRHDDRSAADAEQAR